MPLPQYSTKTPLPPNHTRNVNDYHQGLSIESALQNITSTLVSFNLHELGKKFKLDSEVYQLVVSFNPNELYYLLVEASGETTRPGASAQMAKGAKKALEAELCKMDALFKEMEAAGLYVETARFSIRWLRNMNRGSFVWHESFDQHQSAVSQNTRERLEFRYPRASPRELAHPSTIPTPSFVYPPERHQRWHHEALTSNSRPPHASTSQGYSLPTRRIEGHVTSHSPPRVPYQADQGEPDVPFIPPPPFPFWVSKRRNDYH